MWLFCAIILSKVINNFVNLGGIFFCRFEVFENRKMTLLPRLANRLLEIRHCLYLT